MKKTKLFAVILSTGLMLGALAGCNDTKTSETSATSSETTLDVIRFTDDDTKVIDPAAVTEPNLLNLSFPLSLPVTVS